MDSRPKILLIDDNDDMLDLLEVFLYRDYDLFTAKNGFEGVKLAETEQPDLVITDIMMPVMDGIRLYNELRKHDRSMHVPVIAVTSFIEQMTVKSLLNIGFVAVVAKPLQRDAIVDAVSAALATRVRGTMPDRPAR